MVSRRINLIEPKNRIFVIGDIHGCYNEFEQLWTIIEKGCKFSDDDYLITLGDYIDRGPQSYQVVSKLIEIQKSYKSVYCLRGNHEDMLMSYLGLGGYYGHMFFYNGGEYTFNSYGMSPTETTNIKEVMEFLGEDHINFYKNLYEMVETAKYIFVHGGFDLWQANKENYKLHSNEKLFWVRDEWLGQMHTLGKTVIHGHSPLKTHRPSYNEEYAINIDTGCVLGGKLTCLVIENDIINEIQVKSDYNFLTM